MGQIGCATDLGNPRLCISSPLAQGFGLRHSLSARRGGDAFHANYRDCARPGGLCIPSPLAAGALATQNRVLAHPFFVSPSSLMQAELATVVGGYKKTG